MNKQRWISGVMTAMACVLAVGCGGGGDDSSAKSSEKTAVVTARDGGGGGGTGIGAVPKSSLTAVAPAPSVPEVALPEPSVAPQPVLPSNPDTAVVNIKRFVFTKGVENREPVESDAAFVENDGPVYAFFELANLSGADSEVKVHWESVDGGLPRGEVTLHVGQGPRWRTWAFTRTLKAGDWYCIVTDDLGNELGRAMVTVGEAP